MRNGDIDLNTVAKTTEVNGFKVYIGRSAAMNDILTTCIAQPNDLWFHASGVPGSHVLIRVEGTVPRKDTIKEVAKLAAQNSKGKGKIEVVYTEAKHVKKDRSHNVGQVSLTSHRTRKVRVFSN